MGKIFLKSKHKPHISQHGSHRSNCSSNNRHITSGVCSSPSSLSSLSNNGKSCNGCPVKANKEAAALVNEGTCNSHLHQLRQLHKNLLRGIAIARTKSHLKKP